MVVKKISELTEEEIKKELTKRGIETNGDKPELFARLRKILVEEAMRKKAQALASASNGTASGIATTVKSEEKPAETSISQPNKNSQVVKTNDDSLHAEQSAKNDVASEGDRNKEISSKAIDEIAKSSDIIREASVSKLSNANSTNLSKVIMGGELKSDVIHEAKSEDVQPDKNCEKLANTDKSETIKFTEKVDEKNKLFENTNSLTSISAKVTVTNSPTMSKNMVNTTSSPVESSVGKFTISTPITKAIVDNKISSSTPVVEITPISVDKIPFSVIEKHSNDNINSVIVESNKVEKIVEEAGQVDSTSAKPIIKKQVTKAGAVKTTIAKNIKTAQTGKASSTVQNVEPQADNAAIVIVSEIESTSTSASQSQTPTNSSQPGKSAVLSKLATPTPTRETRATRSTNLSLTKGATSSPKPVINSKTKTEEKFKEINDALKVDDLDISNAVSANDDSEIVKTVIKSEKTSIEHVESPDAEDKSVTKMEVETSVVSLLECNDDMGNVLMGTTDEAEKSESIVTSDLQENKTKVDAVDDVAMEIKNQGDKCEETNKESCSLWISGLPKATKANDLRMKLNQHGKIVWVKIVTSAKDPGSKCFGLVLCENKENAENIITAMNNQSFQESILTVAFDTKNRVGQNIQTNLKTNSKPVTDTIVTASFTKSLTKVATTQAKPATQTANKTTTNATTAAIKSAVVAAVKPTVQAIKTTGQVIKSSIQISKTTAVIKATVANKTSEVSKPTTNVEKATISVIKSATPPAPPAKLDLSSNEKTVESTDSTTTDDIDVKQELPSTENKAVGGGDQETKKLPVKNIIPPPNSIWILGFANSTKAAELKQICLKFGKVLSAKVIQTAGNNNKASVKHYSLITMSTEGEADKCIKSLNGNFSKGCKLTVIKHPAGTSVVDCLSNFVAKKEEEIKKNEEPKSVTVTSSGRGRGAFRGMRGRGSLSQRGLKRTTNFIYGGAGSKFGQDNMNHRNGRPVRSIFDTMNNAGRPPVASGFHLMNQLAQNNIMEERRRQEQSVLNYQREQLELEKLKLERERIESERVRIQMLREQQEWHRQDIRPFKRPSSDASFYEHPAKRRPTSDHRSYQDAAPTSKYTTMGSFGGNIFGSSYNDGNSGSKSFGNYSSRGRYSNRF